MSDEGDDDLIEIYCYVCQTPGHEDFSCPTLRCKMCDSENHIQLFCPRPLKRNAEDQTFISDAISLQCTNVPTKKEFGNFIDTLKFDRPKNDKYIKEVQWIDTSEILIIFYNVNVSLSFYEALKRRKPTWLYSLRFVKSPSKILCLYEGKKILSAVLTFKYAESDKRYDPTYKLSNWIISSEGNVSSLVDKMDFLPSLRAFTENKLKMCDSRNEYDLFVLLFNSMEDLDIFYSWMKEEKLYEDFIKIVDRVGFLDHAKTGVQERNGMEQAVCSYLKFQNLMEKDGFSQFVNSGQVFSSNNFSVNSLGDNFFSNAEDVAICSLCFKIVSNHSTCLLQIGMEIMSISDESKRFYNQYSIGPPGSSKEELTYYGYNFNEKTSKFYQEINCSYLSANIDVLPEGDAINVLISDLESFMSSSRLKNFFVLVHSNFLSLPLFLQALSNTQKLSNFQDLCLGVVDLASVAPLDNKSLHQKGARIVLVPSLDTIFRNLSLPARDIHDPVVLTAVRMRECLQRVSRNHQNVIQILKNVAHPRLNASQNFFCQEVIINNSFTLEASKPKWVTFKRKEFIRDVCLIPESESQYEIIEFDQDRDGYHFKLLSKKPTSVFIKMNHHLGHVISCPWSHLCSTKLNFLPPSPIPCWVGLQVNAILPRSRKSPKQEYDPFSTQHISFQDFSWITPNLAQDVYNVFLISIKRDATYGNITQICLLSIDEKEERSFVYHYLSKGVVDKKDLSYLRFSKVKGKYYYKDVCNQYLAPIDNDLSSLRHQLSQYSKIVLVGYNIGTLLQMLIPQIGHLDNLIGVTDLKWCLSSTYKASKSWFQLVDFNEEELEECFQMNQISLAALQKSKKCVSFNYENLVKSFTIDFYDFFMKYGCKVVLDNPDVLKLSDENVSAYVDIKFHESYNNCPQSISIGFSSAKNKLNIDEILPHSLSRSELISSGYSLDEDSGSWKLQNCRVLELPKAISMVVSSCVNQRSWLTIITANIKIRQCFIDLLKYYDPSGFERIQKYMIYGWCDLISSFYFEKRQFSFVAIDKSTSVALQSLHEYFFNSTPRGRSNVEVMEKIAKSLPLKIEKNVIVPPGNYLTFFLSVQTLDILPKSNNSENSKTLGVIACFTVHNSYSSIVPVIPPPNVCNKSADALHFVKTSSDVWEYGFAKNKDCYSQYKAVSFFLQTMENEIAKAEADGALLVTLTSEELSNFIASVESLSLSDKFIKSVKGVGDISFYLRNERHLENVSTLEELHHFYLQNVDACISSEPNHFSTAPPGNITKYVSVLAKHLVDENYYALTHTFNSDYFNKMLLESNLVEFREGICDIVVAKSQLIPAKSKMRVEARLKGFLFTNGVDERMIVTSPALKFPIRTEECTIIFFKNHSNLLSIENFDKFQIPLIENETIIGRASYSADESLKRQISTDLNKVSSISDVENTTQSCFTDSTTSYEEKEESAPPKKIRCDPEPNIVDQEIEINVEPVPIRKVDSSEVIKFKKNDEIKSKALSTTPNHTSDSRVLDTISSRTKDLSLQIDPNDLPSPEDVREELQGFDPLCLESSYESLLLTLLRLWRHKKKSFDYELGDSLIFRLMSVGLGVENISNLVNQKKVSSIDQLKSELFSEYIVLQEMLKELCDLFFELAWVHFSPKFQSNKGTIVHEPRSPPPLIIEQNTLELLSSKQKNEKRTEFVLKKGIQTFLNSKSHNFIHSMCLVRCIKEAKSGVTVKFLTAPFKRRISVIPVEKVYFLNKIRIHDEGVYLSSIEFAPLKLWNSYQDCVIGFVTDVRSNDISVGFIFEGKLMECLLQKEFVLIYKSLISLGEPIYITIGDKNEACEYIASFGIPFTSLSCFSCVVSLVENEEKVKILENFFHKSISFKPVQSIKKKNESLLLCECANRRIFDFFQKFISNPNLKFRVYSFEGSLCIRGCFELTLETEAKFDVKVTINRGGKVALVGEEICIISAKDFISKKITLK
ncbi:uncharacterized protein [Lepeophtheirus salmonis]|uniref:uncharacterized protein isoform X1 n=1 Tax=Lepeophtheirus salmonis TaxID=72036 RepID=UPI001AEA541D|nr:uncharacterized protein LOC121114315 isoform X1 [Lepeophtheirus salmonis]